MKYLIAVNHPRNFDPSQEDAATGLAIDALNEEMEAAGARFFAGGLYGPDKSKTIRARDGQVTVAEGPVVDGDAYMAGFWILEAASMDDAVEWGRKAAVACRTAIEVRPFH